MGSPSPPYYEWRWFSIRRDDDDNEKLVFDAARCIKGDPLVCERATLKCKANLKLLSWGQRSSFVFSICVFFSQIVGKSEEK